jgi:hypothetical protein
MPEDFPAHPYTVGFSDSLPAAGVAGHVAESGFASFDEALFAARLLEVERFRFALLAGPGMEPRLYLRGRRDPALMRNERVEIPWAGGGVR